MTIRFYKYNGDLRKVNKKIDDSTELRIENALWLDDTNLLTPRVSFVYNFKNIINVLSYNYCYIPYFGRYYFVTDVIRKNGNVVEFNLKVDVLKTYANDILESSQRVIRQESNKHKDSNIVDNRYMIYNNLNLKSIKMSKSSNVDDSTTSCVLTTSGSFKGE